MQLAESVGQRIETVLKEVGVQIYIIQERAKSALAALESYYRELQDPQILDDAKAMFKLEIDRFTQRSISTVNMMKE